MPDGPSPRPASAGEPCGVLRVPDHLLMLLMLLAFTGRADAATGDVAAPTPSAGARRLVGEEPIEFSSRSSPVAAVQLGRPVGTVDIASLANMGTVRRVEVVGSTAPLQFSQDGRGLHVTVPHRASHDFGVALKITGEGLT